jgi:SAM-dependent methyltransferase
VLFIDPVPRERLREIYPPSYYSFSSPSGSLTQRVKAWLDARMFRRLLRCLPQPTLRVLDVGGGAGWELNIVRALDPRVVLTQVVDFDEAAAAVARSNGHGYFCGRIEEFETDETFDLVLMLNLIEHVHDPVAVLRRVRSLLSRHGRVLIKTPNYDSLDARVFRRANWGGYHCPRHWVLFTKESFTRAAAGVGLMVIDFSYTQGAPFWTTSVLSHLTERGLISVTTDRPAWKHPLYPVLSAAFAAFDFARWPFANLSQMFFVLGRIDAPA